MAFSLQWVIFPQLHVYVVPSRVGSKQIKAKWMGPDPQCPVALSESSSSPCSCSTWSSVPPFHLSPSCSSHGPFPTWLFIVLFVLKTLHLLPPALYDISQTPLWLSDIFSVCCQDLLWSLWLTAVCVSMRRPDGPLTRQAVTKPVRASGVMSLPFGRPGAQVLFGSLLPLGLSSPLDVDWHRPGFSQCKNIKTWNILRTGKGHAAQYIDLFC